MIYVLILLLFFETTIFCQQTESETPLANTTTALDKPLPELGELKLKYFSNNLTLEELYRLASFYLSQQLYHQASELYGQYVDKATLNDIPKERIATAYYNRALALFALKLYNSALPMFSYAYYYNNKFSDAVRMMGTIFFLQKNKEKSLELWTKYINETPTSSPQKIAIQKAISTLSDPNFTFDPKEKEESNSEDFLPQNQQTWPFLNPDFIPNPDAKYQKKRVV